MVDNEHRSPAGSLSITGKRRRIRDTQGALLGLTIRAGGGIGTTPR